MKETVLTSGRLAAQAGVKRETIRFYEKQGLLPQPIRTSGGYRIYEASALKQLLFIRRAKSLGFSLQEISELLALANGSLANCREVRRVAERRLAVVEQQLIDLERLRSSLRQVIGRCKRGGRPGKCPIVERLTRKDQDKYD